MNRERLQLLGRLKRALRIDRRLTHEELLQLAEAIIDFGRMLQAHEGWRERPPRYTVVGTLELADRFREPEPTIKDALLLLETMGRAVPVTSRIWKLKVADTIVKRREETAAA